MDVLKISRIGEADRFVPVKQQPLAGSLAKPYGSGNHHRISWRRAWDVDLDALTATHTPTGFVMVFTPEVDGGYTAVIGSELPPFGADGTLAMDQMFGLRELLKDGWEIWHQLAKR